MLMINTKRFIDRVSLIEGRNGRDLVLSIGEARQLRDELAKLLLDLHSAEQQNIQAAQAKQSSAVSVNDVVITGGKW